MLDIKELVKATKGKLINGNEGFIPRKYVIDSRNIEENPFFIPIVGENTDGHKYITNAVKEGICGFFINTNYEDKDKVIKESIDINLNICIIEVEDTKQALYMAGEYNRNKHIDIPVVAVTGSVGKTSTREMIASVLRTEKDTLVTKANYNSLIGAPIMALEMENQDICVFEIGTDFNGEIERLSNLMKPNIGVITIIGTAHIGIFGSREGIYNEKIQITTHMQENSTLIVNGDDDFLNLLENKEKYNVKKFKNSDAYDILQDMNGIKFKANIYDKEEEIFINEIGSHNIKNAICAIKVAECLNLSKDNIIKGIANYRNFSRRLEKIRLSNDILLVDDTYNASIDSMKSGLKTIDKINGKRKIAVLGDMLELGDFSKDLHYQVGQTFKELSYDKLYVLGKEAKYIADGAKDYLEVKCYDYQKDLIDVLNNELKSGDIVYFKASNGMKFNKIIEELKK